MVNPRNPDSNNWLLRAYFPAKMESIVLARLVGDLSILADVVVFMAYFM
jgi:hypothetical protein